MGPNDREREVADTGRPDMAEVEARIFHFLSDEVALYDWTEATEGWSMVVLWWMYARMIRRIELTETGEVALRALCGGGAALGEMVGSVERKLHELAPRLSARHGTREPNEWGQFRKRIARSGMEWREVGDVLHELGIRFCVCDRDGRKAWRMPDEDEDNEGALEELRGEVKIVGMSYTEHKYDLSCVISDATAWGYLLDVSSVACSMTPEWLLPDPATLSRLGCLESMRIDRSGATDAYLAKLSACCPGLSRLNLAACAQVTDRGVTNLRKLVRVESLRLRATKVRDAATLSDWPELVELEPPECWNDKDMQYIETLPALTTLIVVDEQVKMSEKAWNRISMKLTWKKLDFRCSWEKVPDWAGLENFDALESLRLEHVVVDVDCIEKIAALDGLREVYLGWATRRAVKKLKRLGLREKVYVRKEV